MQKYKSKSDHLENEITRLKGELFQSQQQLDTIRSRGNELAKRATEMQNRLTAEKQELEVRIIERNLKLIVNLLWIKGKIKGSSRRTQREHDECRKSE